MSETSGAGFVNTTITETIPFLWQGTEKALGQFFDGPLPKVGDRVELVVYEVTERDGTISIKAKWKVIAREPIGLEIDVHGTESLADYHKSLR